MDAPSKEVDATDAVYETATDFEDLSPEKYRRMERRVLWKFDVHVLPSLALVCYIVFGHAQHSQSQLSFG